MTGSCGPNRRRSPRFSRDQAPTLISSVLLEPSLSWR